MCSPAWTLGDRNNATVRADHLKGFSPLGGLVSRVVSFLPIGTISIAVGNATGKAIAQALNHMNRKSSMKPILIAVMEKDMTKLMPKEMIRLISRPEYFG